MTALATARALGQRFGRDDRAHPRSAVIGLSRPANAVRGQSKDPGTYKRSSGHLKLKVTHYIEGANSTDRRAAKRCLS